LNHRELFDQYVAELQAARTEALAWWGDLLAREAKKTGSEESAKQAVLQRWPYGPPSHPLVIAVFRKHCLACERLNEEIEARARPEKDNLDDASEEDWGETDERDGENHEHDDDDEADEGGIWEGPIDSGTFLFDMLYGKHEELAEFMKYFAFSPIGIENGRSV
jgi:hypothetical protein